MVLTSVGKMMGLQQKAAGIRNICVLAHVDHGERCGDVRRSLLWGCAGSVQMRVGVVPVRLVFYIT